MAARWLRPRRWRRMLRRIDPVRSIALSLLLAAGLVAGRFGGPSSPIEPLALRPVVVHSPIRLGGAWVHAPKPAPFKLPAPRLPAWRLGMGRAPVGHPVEVSLTAYCLKGTTRRGRYVREGIVAADPRLFPLAHYLEIYVGKRYFGRFLIDDTGGAIRGNRIDIWTPTCRDALLFGRRRGTAILVPRGAEPAPTPDVSDLLSVTRLRR